MLWWPVFYTAGMLIGIVHHEPENSKGIVSAMIKRIAPIAGALLIGIVLNIAGVPLRRLIEETSRTFGNLTVPLILLSVGMQLDFSTILPKLPAAALVCGIRLVVSPLCAIAVAFIIRGVFAVDDVSVRVILLNGAVPVATVVPVLGEHYPMDTAIAGASIVLSTSISLISIPIWIPLVERIVS